MLAWSRLSEGFSLIISACYGVAIVAGTMILTMTDGAGLTDKVVDFVTRINEWVVEVRAGNQAQDDLVFVLFLATLFWFLAHNTVWHVFRVDRVWRAIIPPGFVLLVNNFAYLDDEPLDAYLILYVFLALLLIVRSHVDAREYEWYRNRVRYPRFMRQYFLRVGAAMAILFVLIGWVLPSGDDQENLDRFDNLMASVSNLSETLDNLFSSLESEGVASDDYFGGDELKLGGAITLGDDPVMLINAPPIPNRYYWRSTVYDTYFEGRWEHNRTVRATKEDPGLQLNIGDSVPGARQIVAQEFEMLLPTSWLVYAAPQPVEFRVPVRIELDCVGDPGAIGCVNTLGQVDMSVSRAVNVLREGDRYTVQSSVNIANANDLRAAGIDYPQWVTNRYLQGTEQLTQRVRELTLQIISQEGAVTPYDKAKAIERWLRLNIEYDETIPVPPADRDPIDWLLFDLRRGYCNYYATAMIMMLRSEGIPARMAAGFSEGEFDGSRYLVRDRDAHTWVEVYFPGYGWVEFEPTADENPLDREGDNAPDNPQPTVTPLPTATFTPAPSTTPIPPSPEGGATFTPTPFSNEVGQELSPTPTLTPSPTATPTQIAVAIDQPDTPESQTSASSILKWVLLVIAAIFLILLVLAVVVVFIIWWVEHRGLRGLSMVEKAYARMAIYGRWLGIVLPPQQTPEERRRKLITDVPEGKEPINDITSMYVESHFAPPRKAESDEAAIQAWSSARMAFIKRKFRRWFSWG
jgi:transglutaminase-like putative cysteine protease